MKKILLLLTLLIVGCTDEPNHVQHILETEGYTNINQTGYSYWGCSDDDTGTGFTATSVSGQTVEGVVCCGVWGGKACTTRIW